MDGHKNERHEITKVAIWKGVKSLKRLWTFFFTAYSYMEANSEITSYSRSFNSDSSKNVKYTIRASKEGEDIASSADMEGLGPPCGCKTGRRPSMLV